MSSISSPEPRWQQGAASSALDFTAGGRRKAARRKERLDGTGPVAHYNSKSKPFRWIALPIPSLKNYKDFVKVFMKHDPGPRLLCWQPDKWLGLLQVFEITFAGRYIDASIH